MPGKHRLTATTRGVAAFGSQTAEVDASRSNLLSLAAARVVRLETCPDDRQRRHSRRLVPIRLLEAQAARRAALKHSDLVA
jgi:hypothetical protein